MSNLPAELWSNIFCYLWAERYSNVDRWGHRPALQALIHSNRVLYQAGMPFLYRHCLLRNKNCTRRCLSTLLENDLAAFSVKHLTLSINFSQTSEGEPLLELILSRVLERLRNLISFHLVPYASSNPWPVEPESEERSEYLTQSILSSPQRFPFNLKIFVTTLAFTHPLSEFFESQDSIEHLHLLSPQRPKVDMEDAEDVEDGVANPILPHQLQTFALTHCEYWEDLTESANFWLYNCSTLKHVVLDLDLFEANVDDDDDIYQLEVIPVFRTLTALTLRGEWNTGLGSFLDRFVPCVPNLTYISISAQVVQGLKIMVEAIPIFNSFPRLNTVIFDMSIDKDDFEKWLLGNIELATKVQIYVRLWRGLPHASGHERCGNMRIFYDQDGRKWKYDLFPADVVEFPVPGVCADCETRYDPEKVLNVNFHRG